MSPKRMKFVFLLCFILVVNLVQNVICGNSFLSQYAFSPKPTPLHCFQNITKCYPMNVSTCLDVTLPYRFTYPPLNWSEIDSNDEKQVLSEFASIHSFLSEWNGLRVIPQCWKALQSVLCASFFPRCDTEQERVSLPTPEMCKLIRGPCRLIDQHFHWPPFLRCNDSTIFPPKCPNDYTDLRFAIQPAAQRCQHPLVSTDDSNIWYPGIDGCALRCDRDVFYTEAQQLEILRMISYGSIASIIMTTISCFTYILNWKFTNKFPPICVFWLNASLLVASLGWIPQLIQGRNELVCRADNTTRYGESSIDSSCFLSSFLIYFGMLSTLFWYTTFAYCCYYSYRGSGSRSQSLKEKSAMFYMISILVPFFLTIMNVVLGKIDAEPVYGICFVGLVDTQWRFFMVFIPFTISVILGTYWNFQSICGLREINRSAHKQKSLSSSNERSILRKCSRTNTVMIRLSYTQLYVITAFIFFFYRFLMPNHDNNHQQLDSYIICNLNITNPKIFSPKSSEAIALKQMELDMPYPLMSDYSNYCETRIPRPDMWPIYIQFSLYFLASVMTSSWIFTRSTWIIWRRFFKKYFLKFHNCLCCKQEPSKKEKMTKNCKNPITNEEYGQKIAFSGTGGTAPWPNNTGADQSSLGFLEKAELGLKHHTRRSSSRRRYHDPAEMTINSVTTATSQNSWSTAIKESIQTYLNRRSIPLLNKSGIISSSRNGISNSIFQNNQKQIEPSSVSQVINLQNTEHEQSISDSMTSHIQVDSTQHSTCTEPIGVTISQDENNRNTRRKTKKERKAMYAMVRRRGSDTSGSVISSARIKLQQQKKATTSTKIGASAVATSTIATTTTSTSTGDLPAALQESNKNLPSFQHISSPFHHQLSSHTGHTIPFNSQICSVRPQFATPGSFNHRPSFFIGSPTFQQPIRPRPIRPIVQNQIDGSFTFTHGMSDQTSNQLVNPLEQVRRPESSAQNSTSSTSKATNRSPTIQQSNFALQTLSANQSMMMNAHQSAQQFAYPTQRFPMMYSPNMHSPFGPAGPYAASAGLISNPAALVTPQGSYYNTAAAAAMTLMQQQQQMSYAELQALMQEREAYLSLVTPMRSDSVASSVSKMFPIVLSDSEGMFSDAASIVSVGCSSRSSGRLKDIKKDLTQNAEKLKDEIEDRFKQAEKQAETAGQQDDDSQTDDNSRSIMTNSDPGTSKQ